MAVTNDFIEFILDQLSSWGDVTYRKMFGGVGLYKDGKMFGLIADDVAYLKVDDSNRAMFVAEGSKPFQPYPNKPTTMSYYDVPPDIVESADLFVEWSKKSLAIQKK